MMTVGLAFPQLRISARALRVFDFTLTLGFALADDAAEGGRIASARVICCGDTGVRVTFLLPFSFPLLSFPSDLGNREDGSLRNELLKAEVRGGALFSLEGRRCWEWGTWT